MHSTREEEEEKQEPKKQKETIQFEWAHNRYEKCKYKWVIYGIAH